MQVLQESADALLITLPLFTPEEMHVFVESVLEATTPGTRKLARVIWEMTGGWPLYAEQVWSGLSVIGCWVGIGGEGGVKLPFLQKRSRHAGPTMLCMYYLALSLEIGGGGVSTFIQTFSLIRSIPMERGGRGGRNLARSRLSVQLLVSSTCNSRLSLARDLVTPQNPSLGIPHYRGILANLWQTACLVCSCWCPTTQQQLGAATCHDRPQNRPTLEIPHH